MTQWFPISRLDPNEYWDGVQQAAPVLDRFIDQELEQHGLTAGDLALVGFSQGTMMSLHVGLRRDQQAAAIIGFSGALAGPEHLAAEIKVKPPVLLVHGEADELIPVQAIHQAAQALGAVGVPVRWHISPGVGHGIDGTGLTMAAEFLRDAFAGTLSVD
jgi:phospholipase/carboxylesterase